MDISERPFYTARISFIFINLYGKYCCLCQTSKNIFVLQPFVRVCHIQKTPTHSSQLVSHRRIPTILTLQEKLTESLNILYTNRKFTGGAKSVLFGPNLGSSAFILAHNTHYKTRLHYSMQVVYGKYRKATATSIWQKTACILQCSLYIRVGCS